MNEFEKVINTINLVNATIPGIAGLILAFRNPDGTVILLTSKDVIAGAEANINKANTFLAELEANNG